MIDSTAWLLRTQGLSATGMSQIIKASGSPRGSIYFHFPGGKAELTIAALRAAGESVATRIRAALHRYRSSAAALRHIGAWYESELRRTDYRRGCPVANVAVDASGRSPAIRQVCGEIFAEWKQLIARGLERDGLRRKKAVAVAELTLASLEGALILCRAQRSTAPLRRVVPQLLAVIAESR